MLNKMRMNPNWNLQEVLMVLIGWEVCHLGGNLRRTWSPYSFWVHAWLWARYLCSSLRSIASCSVGDRERIPHRTNASQNTQVLLIFYVRLTPRFVAVVFTKAYTVNKFGTSIRRLSWRHFFLMDINSLLEKFFFFDLVWGFMGKLWTMKASFYYSTNWMYTIEEFLSFA